MRAHTCMYVNMDVHSAVTSDVLDDATSEHQGHKSMWLNEMSDASLAVFMTLFDSKNGC